MKLIVGLGNPGKKYSDTRHNIGFRVVDEFAKERGARLRKRLFGIAEEAFISGSQALIVKPVTFMNLSGGCVAGYVKKFGVALSDVIVICDDINLDLGQIRIRPQGSSGGHNGLDSVIKKLDTEEFARMRLGIKGKDSYADLADYVLSVFKKDEAEAVEELIMRAAKGCGCWLEHGTEKAMNIYNKPLGASPA